MNGQMTTHHPLLMRMNKKIEIYLSAMTKRTPILLQMAIFLKDSLLPAVAQPQDNVLEPEDMKLITESAIDAKLSPNRCQRNNGQKQYPSYRLPTGKGLPAERFREIPDLPKHIPWDIGALYERGKSRKTSTHQCGVCAAIGPVFGPNGDRYRGNNMTVRRAILMCKHSGCLLGYCCASCFNLWHHNEELPENMAHKRSSRMQVMSSGRHVGDISSMIEEECKEEEQEQGMSNNRPDHLLTP